MSFQVTVRTNLHHRDYQVDRASTSNLDPEIWERLRTSFSHARKYRSKLSHCHSIMVESDTLDSFDEPFSPTGRQSPKMTAAAAEIPAVKETRSKGFGIFEFGRRRLIGYCLH